MKLMKKLGCSSIGRASDFESECWWFDPTQPSQIMLNISEMEVLKKLSMCREAAFCRNCYSGQYSLYAHFDDGSAGCLLYDKGGIPYIFSTSIIERLFSHNLLSLQDTNNNSVFDRVYVLNVSALSKFEELKEIQVQISLGTWFKLNPQQLEKLMDSPG